MPTIAQAVKTYLRSVGGKATTDEIKHAINSEYPSVWKASAIQAHLYACVVNNPKAYVHHPYAEKFMYRNSDGTLELYSEEQHGPNEWAPPEGDDEVESVEELAEATVSLERDIEDHLVKNLESIEAGLKFVGRQQKTDIGRVDILAEDKSGTRVIIELKVGDAKDSAVGQIARYLGWFAKKDGKPARGVLIAAESPEGIRYAASAIPNLTLLAYKVHFSFEQATI
jgi:endonuclease